MKRKFSDGINGITRYVQRYEMFVFFKFSSSAL